MSRGRFLRPFGLSLVRGRSPWVASWPPLRALPCLLIGHGARVRDGVGRPARGGAGTAQRAHIGPLDLPAQDAGRARGEDRLQRAITLQVEEVRRDALHVRVSALPLTDPRREAWMAAGRGSR